MFSWKVKIGNMEAKNFDRYIDAINYIRRVWFHGAAVVFEKIDASGKTVFVY